MPFARFLSFLIFSLTFWERIMPDKNAAKKIAAGAGRAGKASGHAPEAALAVKHPQASLPALSAETLPASLNAAMERSGWQNLMPVQSLALPYLLAKRDIMIQSRTGSGKTGAYLLPLLETIDPAENFTQALVLVPTRELALQVEGEANTIFKGTGIRACAIYGGVGYKNQLDALKQGCQIVIGTPGRVLDHLFRRSLDLAHVRVLIFDEADRMLSIGFYPDMLEIARYLPKKRQTVLVSATYPPHVLNLAREFMDSPDLLSLSQKEVHVAEVEHLFCPVKPMDKDRALARILETENPASAIIFCNTKANVHYLTQVLQGLGLKADELSSDSSQARREAVLDKARRGQIQYLVATDVAARGIDIPELSHVFLYEPPEDPESYIHRSGRTGRAGSAGTVISLVDIMERRKLDRIARHYGIKLAEMPAPGEKEVAKACGARLLAYLENRQRQQGGLERLTQDRFIDLARQLAAEDNEDGLNLLAMLLDDAYRQSRSSRVLPGGSAEASVRPRAHSRRRPRNTQQNRKGGGNAAGSREV